MKIEINLPYWKKGMKIKCPECGQKVKAPYVCKCGAELKLKVRLNNMTHTSSRLGIMVADA